MQTKHGIFGPYVFLQSAPGVEAGNLSGPCVARFDSGNEGLADPKLSGDIGLFSTCQDLLQYAGVPAQDFGGDAAITGTEAAADALARGQFAVHPDRAAAEGVALPFSGVWAITYVSAVRVEHGEAII